MSDTFCQVCRHPSPGHEENCPVGSGEGQRGVLEQMQQVMPCPYCGGVGVHVWAGTGQCPGVGTHWSTFSGEEKLLGELKLQVEVNKRLARELIECRLELERMKAWR